MLHLGDSTLRTSKAPSSRLHVGRLEHGRSGLLETAEGSARRCAPLWLGTRGDGHLPAADGQVNRGIGADPFVGTVLEERSTRTFRG